MPRHTDPTSVVMVSCFPAWWLCAGARGLAHVLARQRGCDIVSGSLRLPGRPGDAHKFFSGLDVSPVDYTAALSAADPLCADSPLHPSTRTARRTRRVFATVDDPTRASGRLLGDGPAPGWCSHSRHPPPASPSLRSTSCASIAPDVPVVRPSHGTELLLLEAIASGPPVHWVHAEVWPTLCVRWASACQRLVSSATPTHAAQELLQLDLTAMSTCPMASIRVLRSASDRSRTWRSSCRTPCGWGPGGEPGSVAYAPTCCTLRQGPVLLYVGRFTAVKALAC